MGTLHLIGVDLETGHGIGLGVLAAEKIAAKWVIGFVKSRLNDAENASLFEANGVDEISDNSLILPINVSYGSGYIMINSEVFD